MGVVVWSAEFTPDGECVLIALGDGRCQLIDGQSGQMLVNFIGHTNAVVSAIVYSGVMSFVLLKLVGAVMPLLADHGRQTLGMDLSEHGEEGYVHAGGAGSNA